MVFVCTEKVADENYHIDPVITIKLLRQLAVFDPPTIMERAWESCDKDTYNRIPRFLHVTVVVVEVVRRVIGLLLFTGRGELQKMAVVFPDTRG